jgi:hypothetical protein
VELRDERIAEFLAEQIAEGAHRKARTRLRLVLARHRGMGTGHRSPLTQRLPSRLRHGSGVPSDRQVDREPWGSGGLADGPLMLKLRVVPRNVVASAQFTDALAAPGWRV